MITRSCLYVTSVLHESYQSRKNWLGTQGYFQKHWCHLHPLHGSVIHKSIFLTFPLPFLKAVAVCVITEVQEVRPQGSAGGVVV